MWQGRTVVVVGDVMLDRYVYGHVERISPEAPIPVLHHVSENSMLGGAGNVARNITALGGEAILIGAVGADREGDLIVSSLVKKDNITAKIIQLQDHPTTTKVRYVSSGQQIMRLDIERRQQLERHAIDTVCGWLSEELGHTSALVLSDYAKGLLTPELVARAIQTARIHGVPVVVDPKVADVARYAGASVLAPNSSEAAAIAGVECGDDQQAEIAARIVHERAKVQSIVITRGAQGMTIYDPSDREMAIAHIPTIASEVFDVSGAGDTATAVLALALTTGASTRTAARIGNAAAGIAVSKRGTAVVHSRELSRALGGATAGNDPKIVDNESAAQIVADWKAHGLKVGFTNGCFDLLHPGHIELLKRSRSACDRLVVALNSDASVRRLKGEKRPVQNERARLVVIAAIDSVDLVTLFEGDSPMRLIERLRPDRLIKGADYTFETVVGADLVNSYGGKVILVPIESGHSTTSIITRTQIGAA
jgi:D-beta-D-heptose 7-phosphate kinase/D-beta-D-heptose 1-phosphate adenosyltransferase